MASLACAGTTPACQCLGGPDSVIAAPASTLLLGFCRLTSTARATAGQQGLCPAIEGFTSGFHRTDTDLLNAGALPAELLLASAGADAAVLAFARVLCRAGESALAGGVSTDAALLALFSSSKELMVLLT